MTPYEIILFILGNLGIWLFIVALIVAAVKVRRARAEHTAINVWDIVWAEVLFYVIGIGFLWFGYMHAFQQQRASATIGWQPSPFEWELAWAEIGLAVVALLSLWRGYEMRLAVSLVYVIFSFAAAAQHIEQMVKLHNYAPGNAGLTLWVADIAFPIIVLLLAIAAREPAAEPSSLRRRFTARS